MKKTISIVLVLLMALSIFTITAYAGKGPSDKQDETGHYKAEIYFEEDDPFANPPVQHHVFKDNKAINDAVEGATYDKDSNTLTLKDFNRPDLILCLNMMGEDFKIKVEGDVVLSKVEAWAEAYKSAITFTGDGTIKVNPTREHGTAIMIHGEMADFTLHVESSVQKVWFLSSENAIVFEGVDHSDKNTLFSDEGKYITEFIGEQLFDENIVKIPGAYLGERKPHGYELGNRNQQAGTTQGLDEQYAAVSEGMSFVEDENGPDTNPETGKKGYFREKFKIEKYIYDEKLGGFVLDTTFDSPTLTEDEMIQQGFFFITQPGSEKETVEYYEYNENTGEMEKKEGFILDNAEGGIYVTDVDIDTLGDDAIYDIQRAYPIVYNDQTQRYEISPVAGPKEFSADNFYTKGLSYRYKDEKKPYYVQEIVTGEFDKYKHKEIIAEDLTEPPTEGDPTEPPTEGEPTETAEPTPPPTEGEPTETTEPIPLTTAEEPTETTEPIPTTTEEETTEPEEIFFAVDPNGNNNETGFNDPRIFYYNEKVTINVDGKDYFILNNGANFRIDDLEPVTEKVAGYYDWFYEHPDYIRVSQSIISDSKETGISDNTDSTRESNYPGWNETGSDSSDSTGNSAYPGENETGNTDNTNDTSPDNTLATTDPAEDTSPDNTLATTDPAEATKDTTPNNTSATKDPSENKPATTDATEASTVNDLPVQPDTKDTSTTATTNPTHDKSNDSQDSDNKPIAEISKGNTVKQVDNFVTKQKTEKDIKGSVFGLLCARQKTVKKNTITVRWNKLNGAKKYVVYGSKCGTKKGQIPPFKKITTVKTNSYTQKKLKKGTYYKYLIVALDKNDKVITSSKTVHVVTNGGKNGNDKTVTVNKGTVSIKKGKTFTLKTKEVPQSKAKKVKRHRQVKYESSNIQVAKVTQKGKITAKKKGTAYIYAYAQNGLYKKVKVTVK